MPSPERSAHSVGGEPHGAVASRRRARPGRPARSSLRGPAQPCRRAPRPRPRSRGRRLGAAAEHRAGDDRVLAHPGAVEEHRPVQPGPGADRRAAADSRAAGQQRAGGDGRARQHQRLARAGPAAPPRARCRGPGRPMPRTKSPACPCPASTSSRRSRSTAAPAASSPGNVSRSTETGRPAGIASSTVAPEHVAAGVDLVGRRVLGLLQERLHAAVDRRSARSRTRAGRSTRVRCSVTSASPTRCVSSSARRSTPDSTSPLKTSTSSVAQPVERRCGCRRRCPAARPR